ncbi:NADPH:quinone reductase [Mesorhizobium albiziae]|uniref:NADPH:quinone reductase n=1 Tax=Neomesorhizobium albiziae TaxID=335020 RepID=A0A1I4D6Q8_9HYPH|nr:zinc-binding alcohol dehydrogenase family protein [Mesorhizobium albiziae]GLS33619.1 NADPH:quinone reductase [Mesorhizobium albiziae]SFK89202.1 NADPH:quinone reductase [Mesorhizobium albiziae]
MTVPKTMRAVVIHQAGGPETLRIETRRVPKPGEGQVLIRVKAFGLNRSELFTRRGLSPIVDFPRVLGIEAVGTVAEVPCGAFTQGDIVATAMGGMGRQFDGGYADYVCVPTGQVQRLRTVLPWDLLGAMPEMLQTAWGSLFTSLQLRQGDRLLIRGGTSSIGLAATMIAKAHRAVVIATTRNPDRERLLRERGVDQVLIDTGEIASQVREVCPNGVDKVLELVGATTLRDSLRCVRPRGILCMTGIVGDQWSLDGFNPLDDIPTAVSLTSYSGGVENFMRTPLQALVDEVEDGELRLPIGRVFKLDEIVEAHRVMEANAAGGKVVVLT